MKIKKEIKAFIITLASLGSAIILFAGILIIRTKFPDVKETVLAEPTQSASAVTLPEAPTLDFPEPETHTEAPGLPDSCLIESFKFISQFPELPTGCEVTSLAMLLAYLGFDVDKLTLADNFLPKAAPGTASFYTAFAGNPRSSTSYGCFAPVIIQCAASYLRTQDTNMKIYNYTGSDFSVLLEEVADGHPCIVWGTISLLEPYPAEQWIVDGEICQWYSQEHCMVLIGYDFEKSTVTVADPLYGIKTYDLGLFETRYDQMFKQALCIY